MTKKITKPPRTLGKRRTWGGGEKDLTTSFKRGTHLGGGTVQQGFGTNFLTGLWEEELFGKKAQIGGKLKRKRKKKNTITGTYHPRRTWGEKGPREYLVSTVGGKLKKKNTYLK